MQVGKARHRPRGPRHVVSSTLPPIFTTAQRYVPPYQTSGTLEEAHGTRKVKGERECYHLFWGKSVDTSCAVLTWWTQAFDSSKNSAEAFFYFHFFFFFFHFYPGLRVLARVKLRTYGSVGGCARKRLQFCWLFNPTRSERASAHAKQHDHGRIPGSSAVKERLWQSRNGINKSWKVCNRSLRMKVTFF